MKMTDRFDEICIEAEKENDRTLWLKAAAVALLIAARKNAKHLAAYWAEEAVGCIAEVDAAAAAEEFDKLLYLPEWEARDEVTRLFEQKYFPIAEVLP